MKASLTGQYAWNPTTPSTGSNFNLKVEWRYEETYAASGVYAEVRVYDFYTEEFMGSGTTYYSGFIQPGDRLWTDFFSVGPMPNHHALLNLELYVYVHGGPYPEYPSDTWNGGYKIPHPGPFLLVITDVPSPSQASHGQQIKINVKIYNPHATRPDYLLEIYDRTTGSKVTSVCGLFSEGPVTKTITTGYVTMPNRNWYLKAVVKVEKWDNGFQWVETDYYEFVIYLSSLVGGCPVWSVHNGMQYETVKSLGMHSEYGVDVIQTDSYAVTSPFATDTLKIKLEEPVYFRAHGSVLDYVSVKVNGQTATLTSAVHSSLGDITSQISRSDDQRVKLAPGQTIELTFKLPKTTTVDTVEITVEGYNPWGVPGVPVKLTPLWLKILIAIAVFAFAWYIIKQLR